MIKGGNMNYKQFYTIKQKYERELKQQCPELDHKSGLYFLSREEQGQWYAYIGKSVNLLDRMVSHLRGYDQHIDISLKKRKWYSEDNPEGWRVDYKKYSESELDDMEIIFAQFVNYMKQFNDTSKNEKISHNLAK